MRKPVEKALSSCVTAAKVLYQSDFSYRASSLAFSTLLSLVPIVSVFVFVMTQVSIFSALNQLAKDYVLENFVPASSEVILTYLNQFTLQASQLPIFSLIFLFITSIFLIITVDEALNAVWQKKRRPDFFHLFIYPLIVLLIPIFIVISALLSSFLFLVFSYFPEIKILTFTIPLALNTLMLSILYTLTANSRLRWDALLLGSFIGALLLELSKTGFAVYVNQFSNYDAIYGALATIPILLIWLYIFWLIVIYGAFIVKIQAKTT
jgi:membrane protein